MSQLLSKAKEIRDREVAEEVNIKLTASRAVVDIAVREILGQSKKDDAHDLVDAMADAEMTEADYEELLEVIPKLSTYEARIQYYQEQAVRWGEMRAKYLALKARCEDEIEIAEREFRLCDKGSQLSEVQSNKARLVARFPDLFDNPGSPQNAKPIDCIAAMGEGKVDDLRRSDETVIERLREQQEAKRAGAIQRAARIANANNQPVEVEAPKVTKAAKVSTRKADLPSVE